MERINLKVERVKKNYSVKEMAWFLGVSKETYYNYENGKINIPLSKAQKISEILNSSLDVLFPIKVKN